MLCWCIIKHQPPNRLPAVYRKRLHTHTYTPKYLRPGCAVNRPNLMEYQIRSYTCHCTIFTPFMVILYEHSQGFNAVHCALGGADGKVLWPQMSNTSTRNSTAIWVQTNWARFTVHDVSSCLGAQLKVSAQLLYIHIRNTHASIRSVHSTCNVYVRVFEAHTFVSMFTVAFHIIDLFAVCVRGGAQFGKYGTQECQRPTASRVRER